MGPAMNYAATLKVGDRAPKFESTLKYEDGDPIDLTGATVTFRAKREIFPK